MLAKGSGDYMSTSLPSTASKGVSAIAIGGPSFSAASASRHARKRVHSVCPQPKIEGGGSTIAERRVSPLSVYCTGRTLAIERTQEAPNAKRVLGHQV